MIEKITRLELEQLGHGLTTVGNLPGAKFAYAVAKNLRHIDSELSDARSAFTKFEASEPFKKMESERMKLCQVYCKKDKDGKPIMSINSYVMKDQAAFEVELKNLREKEHAETWEKYQALIVDHKKLMEEKIEFDLHKIPLTAIPENITGKQLSTIMLIIQEEAAQ